MTMQKGIKSERPIADIVIGAVLILIGVYIFLPMLPGLWSPTFLEPQNNLHSRYAPIHFVVMGLVPIPIGIYLVINALQKRYFLLIDTTKGIKRKIVFNGDISSSEIRSFIEQAQAKYGYHIATTTQEE